HPAGPPSGADPRPSPAQPPRYGARGSGSHPPQGSRSMSTTTGSRRPPAPVTKAHSVALRAVDLVKTYPGKPPVRALDGLCVEVAAGTVFGLLGPNGAGKSTPVKILTTLSRADSGTAEVAGLDVTRRAERVRRTIGLVSQKSSSDPMATGRE